MSERIVIDPITRIEGHLRVEAEIEGGGVILEWNYTSLRRMYFHPLACLGTGGRERTGYRDPSQRQYGS